MSEVNIFFISFQHKRIWYYITTNKRWKVIENKMKESLLIVDIASIRENEGFIVVVVNFLIKSCADFAFFFFFLIIQRVVARAIP